VGVSYVLQCKSAAKVRAMMAEYTAVVNDLYRAGPEPINQLALTYATAAEVVSGGEAKVDLIRIDHPELMAMDEDDRAKLTTILGEGEMVVRLAQADEKTLVLTFGGSKGFLASATKEAAGGEGKLAKDPNLAKSLATLPKNRVAVMALNLGNVFKVIQQVSKAINEPAPPINIDAPEPLVASVSVEKADVVIAGYIPMSTIKAVAGAWMGMMMGGPGGMPPGGGAPGPAPAPGGDF